MGTRQVRAQDEEATATAAPARVSSHVDGVASAECCRCGTYLELEEGASLHAAAAAFLAAHPPDAQTPHDPCAPPGWVVPLGRWCALSQ